MDDCGLCRPADPAIVEFVETVKIRVPYVTTLAYEIKIYEKDYNKNTMLSKYIATHAIWAILTRPEEPKYAGLNLLQKLKLYNGKSPPGFTEDNIKELREQTLSEGMLGISPATCKTESRMPWSRIPRPNASILSRCSTSWKRD